MEAEQEIREGIQHEEEAYEESLQQEQKNAKTLKLNTQGEDRSSFVHGLSVGLGMGCIATFVIVWLSVFFALHLSSTVNLRNYAFSVHLSTRLPAGSWPNRINSRHC